MKINTFQSSLRSKTIRSICATGFAFGTLALSTSAFAAGFAVTTHSGTATALGGVGTANSEEPNSSYFNPAAMTEKDALNIYIGTTVIIPKITYEGPNGETAETVDAVLPPPNFHLAIPFTDEFAAGIGVTLPYGLTVEYEDDWVGREQIRRQRLQTIDVNPNVAYKFGDTGLSVAVGGQLVFGTVELENTSILRDDKEVNAHIGGTAIAFGATAAVLYKPTENLSFGVNYRSAFKLDFEGVAHFEGEEGTPFENTFVDQDVTTEINLPHAITTGVGYRTDKVFVGFEVGFTTWSANERIDLQFSRPCTVGATGCDPETDATNPPTSTILSEWFDAPVFRLGAEYKITESWPVRVGAAYDMTPIPDANAAPSLPGNDRAVITAGTGYTWNSFRADLGYMLVLTSRELTNGKQDGKYNTTANLIGINLGYGF